MFQRQETTVEERRTWNVLVWNGTSLPANLGSCVGHQVGWGTKFWSLHRQLSWLQGLPGVPVAGSQPRTALLPYPVPLGLVWMPPSSSGKSAPVFFLYSAFITISVPVNKYLSFLLEKGMFQENMCKRNPIAEWFYHLNYHFYLCAKSIKSTSEDDSSKSWLIRWWLRDLVYTATCEPSHFPWEGTSMRQGRIEGLESAEACLDVLPKALDFHAAFQLSCVRHSSHQHKNLRPWPPMKCTSLAQNTTQRLPLSCSWWNRSLGCPTFRFLTPPL